MQQLSFIERLIGAVILFIIVAMVWAFSTAKRPNNYHYDPYTESVTWTDDEGRTMIKSPDGSIRELSKEATK